MVVNELAHGAVHSLFLLREESIPANRQGLGRLELQDDKDLLKRRWGCQDALRVGRPARSGLADRRACSLLLSASCVCSSFEKSVLNHLHKLLL